LRLLGQSGVGIIESKVVIRAGRVDAEFPEVLVDRPAYEAREGESGIWDLIDEVLGKIVVVEVLARDADRVWRGRRKVCVFEDLGVQRPGKQLDADMVSND
jgi:hypothetical protein